jgi:hypothetical protein
MLVMLFSASRSYDMLDEERPVRRETLLHTSLCRLCRMQATRSHHVGLCLRRRPGSKGARMPMPPAQRKASTLIELQGEYDTAMLKYRCGMQHPSPRLPSQWRVYPRSGRMLAVLLQVSRLN